MSALPECPDVLAGIDFTVDEAVLLCRVLNALGDGACGVWADESTLPGFERRYALKCLALARGRLSEAWATVADELVAKLGGV